MEPLLGVWDNQKMRVLVCGSRNWEELDPITEELALLQNHYGHGDIEVIHGAARGADEMAGWVAAQLGYQVRKFPADWKTHGKAAGPIRNRQMLDEKPDLVLAFQINGSRGTQDTIDEAKRRGIPTRVTLA